MSSYITHGLATYSAKNKKWEAMIDRIRGYNNMVLMSKDSLEQIKKEISQEVAELNELYPKSKELVASLQLPMWYVHTKGNTDEWVFRLYISGVNYFID